METTEVKKLCLIRVPPGDRWREPEGTEIFDSLTSGLEKIFQKTNCKEYRFSAESGEVYSITIEELEAPKPKSFSIYGDR